MPKAETISTTFNANCSNAPTFEYRNGKVLASILTDSGERASFTMTSGDFMEAHKSASDLIQQNLAAILSDLGVM